MTRLPIDVFAYFPPHLAGKWRTTAVHFIEQDGKNWTECVRYYGDMYYTAFKP